MTMDIAKLEKMKVAELRNELQARGLDTKGVKAVLVERLKAAIESKGSVEGGAEISTPSRRSRRTRSMTRSPSPSPVKKIEPTLEPLIEEDKQETKGEDADEDSEKIAENENVEQDNEMQTEESAETEEETHETEEVDQSNTDSEMTSEKPEDNGATDEADNIKPVEKMELDDSLKEEQKEKQHEEKSPEKRKSRKRSHSKSKSRSRSRDRSHSKSRSKHSHSRSPKGKRGSSVSKNMDDTTNEEDEPVIEDKQFGLSWLDSDLHLLIDPVTFTSAKPMSQDIYSLVWSGARTNYGVREGKVCYEVRLAEETHTNQFRDEPFTKGLRCGFSTTKTKLLLGEDENSFAYCESGKKALNSEFQDYGKPFKLDDVIGCYLDLDSTPCTIQFTLNGEELGTAFEFEKSILGEEDALFPHILVKGYEILVNFADSENLLGNMERPTRMRKKEKPRKESVKSDDERNKNLDDSEEKWEVVDEAKMDENENDEKEEEDVVKKNDEELKEEEAENKEEKTTENNDVDEEMKDNEQKEESQEEQKDEENDDNEVKDKDSQGDEVNKDKSASEEKPIIKEKKENGQKQSDGDNKKRKSRDSNPDYEMEEILPEKRDEVFLLPGYELIALTPEEKFISGPQRPESRKECEVYLLVGLPGSGKTYWAQNHIKENPDKRYHVIGADDLISKMTIDGKPRKSVHKGNWDRVYEMCLQSLSALEEIATKRRRNYILDQTNAFASAQRRKMKGFGDFKRNAVVCIPSEEELKRRNQLKTEAGNANTIRESTLNNLKASFTLPSLEFGWFDTIIYTDLKDDEAKNEVKRYNEKGNKDIDASRDKRPRRDSNRYRDDRRRHEDRRRDDFRGSRWKGNNNNDRRGGSGNRWGGNQSRGSSQPWRDDRGYGGGGGGGGRSYDNRNNRYGGGGGGGGGGNNSQNWVNNNRNRYNDRFAGGRSGGGGNNSGSRYDSYGGGSRDYRDRGRDRNGHGGGDSGSRRDGSYRSGNQRDFRSGHRDNRTEDSRGGFERSKYSSNDSSYDYNKSSGHTTNTSQGKWVQMQGGNWSGQQQVPQQQQEYWGYDQSQAGYQQQSQQQWSVNSADPRQQQWVNWYQTNSQSQQQGMPDASNQQYWSQYSYPTQDGTTVMPSHSDTDGPSKK